MSRTRRKYNNPRTRIYKHLANDKCFPIDKETLKTMVLCVGHCPMCKDPEKSIKERTEKEKAFQFEYKQAMVSFEIGKRMRE